MFYKGAFGCWINNDLQGFCLLFLPFDMQRHAGNNISRKKSTVVLNTKKKYLFAIQNNVKFLRSYAVAIVACQTAKNLKIHIKYVFLIVFLKSLH